MIKAGQMLILTKTFNFKEHLIKNEMTKCIVNIVKIILVCFSGRTNFRE